MEVNMSTRQEPQKTSQEKKEGFSVDELLKAVDKLVEQANKNDYSAKEVLDSAREKSEKCSYYAL